MRRVQTSLRAATSASMSSSLCNGEGVRRRRDAVVVAAEREYRERHEVEADAARFSMQIENVPSVENPRTGRLTPLSVIAALRKLSSPLAIGT
jgi:predicted dinucleotide-utilizing enzyme